MSTIEVKVPAIGDYADVPVIDVLVKPGDAVQRDDSLVTLESEKATMDVPSPAAGRVRDLRVKVGDRVSEGSLILTLDADGAAAGAGTPQTRAEPPPKAAPAPARAPAPAPAAEARAPASSAAPPSPTPAAARTVEVTVPPMGDFQDVPIIDVLVKPGDEVQREQSLVTLESEKATMDVPAPEAGRVRAVHVKAGDRVSEGAPIATLEATGAPAAARTPAAPAPAPAPAPARAAAPEPSTPPREAPAPASAAAGEGRPVPHASPSVRRFARELGVDLGRVEGTGPRGRVVHDDVQRFVKAAMTAAPSPAAAGGALAIPAWPKPDFERYGPVERQPLGRIQRLSGPNLSRNWVMIPHVTQHDEADITDLEAFRVALNREREREGVKVTLLAFVVKACVAALKQYPVVNASLDGGDLVLKRYYHVGFAADTPGGLVVPVLRDADRKGVLEIARELAELAAKARDGKLAPADIQGGTFSISSLGGIGGTAFTPIVNAPEVAILGVSRARTQPVWDGERFAPRLVLPLSLSYDHRVVDGALGARFTAHVAKVLGDMRRAML